MLLYTIARFRAISCLLLLAFCATLLPPAHHVSAEEQPVVIPKEEMQVSLLDSLWQRTKDANERRPAKRIEDVLAQEIAIRTTIAKNRDPNQIVGTFRKNYQARVNSLTNPSFDTLVLIGLDQAATMPELKGELQAIAAVLLINTDQSNLPTDQKDQIATGTTVFFQNEIARLEKDQVRRVVKKAKDDPQFAAQYDQENQARIGASITELDDVQKFIRDHPDDAIPPQIAAAVRADGSVAISLAELNDLARSEFGKINASIDDLQLTVGTINAKQDVLLDYVLDQREREAAQALAAAKAEEHRLKLQVAGSAINIVSTLAGYVDPERGQQISVIGNSILQIADAYTSWTEAVAGLGTLEALGSLSTAAMTGNVISAVFTIVSLFGPAQPTPEQMILEQIGKLREQVSELRTEMHDRFDRVDEQLNAIYTTMQDRFDKIDIRLGKIDGNIQEIQQTLVRLDQTLSRIERNSFEFLDATNRRPLLNAINGALGYKARTGLDMPYQPDFVAYENDFHSWGTIYAYDALSAGPTVRDYSDSAVLAELNAYPLDVNINYLNDWLLDHGMQPFASKRLPGPRDWLFASRAYAQLGFEWPEHASKIKPERQAVLDAGGNDLQQAIQNISTRLTPDGPQGNAPLFNDLNSYYNQQLGAFDSGLQATQAAFVQEQAGQFGRSAPFDLYGGLDQQVNYMPSDMSTMTCGGVYEALPAPSNLNNAINDNSVILADYLNVRNLKVCLSGMWVDRRPYCPSICLETARHRAIIRMNGGTYFVDAPTREICTPSCSSSRRDQTVAGWQQPPYYKAQFEALFANVTPPDFPDPYMTVELRKKLLSLQQQFQARVTGEMGSGSLKDEALKLAGAKKLLESFVALGMPQALEGDDLLRSLLYSNQALIDDQQVALAYTRPISPTQLTVNPRVTLMATATKRQQALGDLLTRYTEAINARTYSEPISLIGETRLRMRLALTLAGVDVIEPTPDEPTPGGTGRIFLPLLGR